MKRVGVDILGFFPRNEVGNCYMLMLMDYFTKWPKVHMVPDQSAVTTAEKLIEEFNLVYRKRYTATEPETLRCKRLV